MQGPGLEVAVVGAGTAGSAVALLLARAGHRVSLFEAVASPGAVGAGIMLQPTGMAVLERLGLLDELLLRGSRVASLRCLTEPRGARAGRTVLDLAYQDVRADAFGLGMHRGALFRALFEAARSEPLVTTYCGESVDEVKRSASGLSVVTASGNRHGPYAFVVIADGARSALRRHHTGVRRVREYRWGALWAILEDPERRFDGVLHQVVSGTQEMMGFLPSGLGPSGETPLVSVFWSIRADRIEAFREAGLASWKTRALELEPRAGALLSQVQSPDDLLFARYHDVVMSPWHTEDGIVFVGDAGHAMSPQLGQGANLALVDAAELADSLAETNAVSEALALYSRRRRASLAYYQWATRFLTPFFQSDHTSLGLMRDLFMAPMCRVPYTRNKMVRTMCGVERGLLSAPAPWSKGLGG